MNGQVKVLLFVLVLGASAIFGSTAASAVSPTVSVNDADKVSYTTARVGGSVNPEGQATSWRFQYATQADFSDALNGPAGSIPASSAETGVEGRITGLQPHTVYYLRLLAENVDGKSEAVAGSSFETLEAAAPTTDPPLDNASFVTSVTATEATLNSKINPAGADTTYRFQYVEQATYEASEFASATSTPDQALDALADPSLPSSAEVAELEPATTYRYRVIAENAKGSSTGYAHSFRTLKEDEVPGPDACPNAARRTELHANRLPNCRAYEMVSPPEKNGGFVIPQSYRTHLSSDGESISFSSIASFADPKASGFSSQYLSHRTAEAGTNGWSTHSIMPLSGTEPLAFADSNGPYYPGFYTPDLSSGIFRSWRPLTHAPNAETVSNLYRIDGLADQSLTPTLLTDSYKPMPHFEFFGKDFEEKKTTLTPYVVGTSTDLSHVVFEAPRNLIEEAPPQDPLFCEATGFACQNRLYENVGGTIRLVGSVPKAPETECDDETVNSCEIAASAQIAMSPAGNSPRMVSTDGSRIVFSSGSNIYLREDAARTVQLNVSEDGSPEFQPAGVMDASTDGSRVFFSTNEQMLAADHDSAPDLYMYEVEKPAGEHLTLVSEGTSGADGYLEAVIGTNDDGHYAYFVSDGELITGSKPPSGIMGLYAWHDGDLSYVGSFKDIGDPLINSTTQIAGGFPCCSKRSRITPDGRHLLFSTASDEGFRGRGGFTSYDHNGKTEFYLYDADSGHLACVSCNPTGEAATRGAEIDVQVSQALSKSTIRMTQGLSDDGRFVFFNSFDGLVPEDTNGTDDAYEYDSQSGEISLLSTGTSADGAWVTGSSKDGHDVFLATTQRLSARDTDGAYDLYDARIGGGFPEPPPTTAPCNGDSCLLPGAAAAPVAPIASGAAGAGNPRLRCPKARQVRRNGKVRCSKPRKHHSKRNQAKSRANSNRRAAK